MPNPILTAMTAICVLAAPGLANAEHVDGDLENLTMQRIESLKTGIDIRRRSCHTEECFLRGESLRQTQGRLMMELRRTLESRDAALAEGD
jgi:hypothetical protein